MTLNITVLTRERVYQSSDFRLTEQPGGKLVTDASTKAISVQNEHFFGVLTYTGLGRWAGKDTADYVIAWLQAVGDVPPDALADGLAERATDWLRQISPRGGSPYRLTMVMAGFDAAGDLRASLISNFENEHAQAASAVAPVLTAATIHAGGSPTVVITGWKPAVTRERRRLLQKVVRRHQDQPERVRQAIAECNEAASPNSNSTVSPACTVIMFNRDGSGFQELTPGSQVDFKTVTYGVVGPDIRQILQQLGVPESRLRGASFARAGPSLPAVRAAPCRPELRGTNPTHRMVEISPTGSVAARARGINDAGVVVGDVRQREDNNVSFWRSSVADVDELVLASVSNNSGTADLGISATGDVVGGATGIDGYVRAFRWTMSAELIDLGGHDGRDSAATAVTAAGEAAGWACLSATDRGQLQYRPALWNRDGITVVTEIPADWGQAIAVAGDSTLLLWLHRGSSSLPALRAPNGDIDLIGGERARGVIPLALGDSGTVLGAAETNDGRIALVSENLGAWRELGTPVEYSPGAMSSNGHVVGHFRQDGFDRPWLLTPEGVLRLLQYYRYHHCRPFAVNNRGQVAGAATADHGSHALVWI